MEREDEIKLIGYSMQILWQQGINPNVIPNGIPRSLFSRMDS